MSKLILFFSMFIYSFSSFASDSNSYCQNKFSADVICNPSQTFSSIYKSEGEKTYWIKAGKVLSIPFKLEYSETAYGLLQFTYFGHNPGYALNSWYSATPGGPPINQYCIRIGPARGNYIWTQSEAQLNEYVAKGNDPSHQNGPCFLGTTAQVLYSNHQMIDLSFARTMNKTESHLVSREKRLSIDKAFDIALQNLDSTFSLTPPNNNASPNETISYQEAINLIHNEYRSKLCRDPSNEDLSYWRPQIMSGSLSPENFEKSIEGSTEFLSLEIIREMYTKILKREADCPGLRYWWKDTKKGQSFEQIEANIRRHAK